MSDTFAMQTLVILDIIIATALFYIPTFAVSPTHQRAQLRTKFASPSTHDDPFQISVML